MCEKWSPPEGFMATSLLMHSPRLSIYLYHTIITSSSTDIPLSSNALFTPSIHFTVFLSNFHLMHQILLFSSLTSSIISLCPNHLNTHCFAWPANSLVTPVLLHTSSFLTLSTILITSHTHLISITFNLFFSATAILHVSAPYCIVGTATPSYRLFFTLIIIALQLNIFILPKIFLHTVLFDTIIFHLYQQITIQCNILPSSINPIVHFITLILFPFTQIYRETISQAQ